MFVIVAAPASAQAPLEIESPRSGTQFRPGQTVTITVHANRNYQQVVLMAGAGLKDDYQALNAAPYVFSFPLPADLDAGLYTFTALGSNGPLGVSEPDSSNELEIDVEPVWPSSADCSRQVSDAPGVTVDTGGIPVRHRLGISYPPEALAHGIEGTVVAEVTLDGEGHPEGVHVLSGPVELAKHVIQSVSTWHYAEHVGTAKARPLSINFNLADAKRASTSHRAPDPQVVESIPYAFWVSIKSRSRSFILEKITILGMSEDLAAQVMAFFDTCRLHQGDELSYGQLILLRGAPGRVDADLNTWLNMEGNRIRVTVAPIGSFPSERDGQGPIKTQHIPPGVDTERVEVSETDQVRKLISKVAPEYPLGAKLHFIQGVVRVGFVIGKDGKVIEAGSSGPRILAEAAEDAVKKWIYAPTLLHGRPVEVFSETSLEFFLPY